MLHQEDNMDNYKSENINELATALSKMQGNMGPIYKNKTAKIPTKSGATYSYTYADLAGIWECIRKPLLDTGLSVTQTFNGSLLITILMHSSGQWIKSELPLNCMGLKPQELGSEITYLRRYALTGILGLSADEEDDGAQAQESNRSSGNKYPPTTITSAQANELKSLLEMCDEDYQKNFWNFLRNQVKGIDKIDQLPSNLYDRIKNAVVKKKEESMGELIHA